MATPDLIKLVLIKIYKQTFEYVWSDGPKTS
jgi:hypothetical protein